MRLKYYLAAFLWASCLIESKAQAASAPTVDMAKQALEKKWLKLKPDHVKERNVLFQDVRPGRATGGSYPFQVTVLIRDYDAGYPPNRYYGKTCVARIEQGVYTLSLDAFGQWEVDGRMTPDLNQTQCKNNPAAGVSSIPLETLSGTAAPRGQVASSQPVAPQPGMKPGTVMPGSYECWANGQANLTLNFKIDDATRYTGYNGSSGTYSFDPGSQRITFKGGSLDGVMPQGFYSIYYAPQGRPTVSFRSARGSEAAFCEKK